MPFSEKKSLLFCLRKLVIYVEYPENERVPYLKLEL